MYMIELQNGQRITGEIVKMDKKMLKVKVIALAPITLFSNTLRIGDKVKLDGEEFVIEDVVEGGVKLSKLILVERKSVKAIKKIENL
uniref:ORF86 n=2 Tax=Saccharolobus islandicus TaxID=43080 RepID=Q9C4V4_SACIS|nr:ORF86 [Sulfolobus islandicus]